jgi:ABC-2 type transport system permease protein
MNPVIVNLTRRSLLGKRRAILLLLMPLVLILIAGLVSWRGDGDVTMASGMIQGFGLGTLLPLICLLIGTGVIGPEIEDKSIMYILAKPVARRTIVLSKLAVAYGAAAAFAVVPVMIATLIASRGDVALMASLGVAGALASFAYITVFFALAVATRNAVIVGLLYAVLWETVLGGFAPGVRALSVRQWSLAPAEQLAGSNAATWNLVAEVGTVTGLVALAITVTLAFAFAVRKLSRLQLNGADA